MTTENANDRTSAAAREALLRDAIEARRAASGGERKQYAQTDWVYDMTQQACWCLVDGRLRQRESVNGSVPESEWRVVAGAAAPAPEEGAAPRGRGRPAGGTRERRIAPYEDIKAIASDQTVEDSTWWPGHPQIIADVMITQSGQQPAPGQRLFNTYRPPWPMPGRSAEAERWVEHVKRVWPDPKDHVFFFDYCAHMVQRPYEKCNTAIVLSGGQGIGKDAALVPLAQAVGGDNYHSIDPDVVFDSFNPWAQTVMLVVNEVRPSNDDHRATSFYNIMKPYIAAPPYATRLNEKNMKGRYVMNVMRVFMTTNDRMSMYLPDEDRRMHIMHSELQPKWEIEAGRPDYFAGLFDWLLKEGGAGHVAAWLRERDISAFEPNRAPEKTNGWKTIVNNWSEPEDGITFALEHIGRPEVLFGSEMAAPQFDDYEETLKLMRSRHRFMRRMATAGYEPVTSPEGKAYRYERRGGVLKSSTAFKCRKSGLSDEQARGLLDERGYRLAEARAAS